MWTDVRTKRFKISSRQRRKVEEFIHRTFNRERRRIGSLAVYLGRGKFGRTEAGFICRIRISSNYLGMITIDEAGDTLRTAVQQASLRIREVLRRRLHKRHKRFRADVVQHSKQGVVSSCSRQS